MKNLRLLSVLIVSVAGVSLRAHDGCACDSAPVVATKSGAAAPAEAPRRHPLKGVVVEVIEDRSALLVKHEEIPGVMKAMTMLLKVDEAGLKVAQKGDAITGLLVRKADGWWLEEVAKAGGR